MKMILRTTFVAVLLAAGAAVGGCQVAPGNSVSMTRNQPDLGVVEFFDWKPQHTWLVEDPRGQHEFVAESAPADAGRPVYQRLHLKIIYPIDPPATGHDNTTLNVRVDYLVSGDPEKGAGGSLLYEGVGHVYVDQPWWALGRRRFELRRALLRLRRASETDPKDPFGSLELNADLSATPSPEAAEKIQQFNADAAALQPVQSAKPE